MRSAAVAASSAVRTTSLRGTGRPGRREELVRHLLVGGDVHRERRRHRRHRRPDPLLVLPLAELDQRSLVEAHPRDVTRRRLVDDRLGGGSERPPLGELDQALELGEEVEVLLGLDRVVHDPDRELARPRRRRSPPSTRRSRCSGRSPPRSASCRARCARRSPAGAPAPRARRRDRARSRRRAARRSRPAAPSEHECSATPGSSDRRPSLNPGIWLDGHSSSEPRSTSIRTHGS